MAGKKIGIVLALDGERQFSQGVSNAKKESAMLNSELKNSAQNIRKMPILLNF